VRFASFELDCGTGELFKNGRRLKLQDQPARLLILLVSRAGSLVTREEIQSALWEDGQFVEFEHAINVAIKKIREALGDDPLKPRILETLPRRGYRFIAAVESAEESIDSKPAEAIANPVPVAAELAPVEVAIDSTPTPLSVPAAPAVPVIAPPSPPIETPQGPSDEETLEREFALPAVHARIMFLAVQVLYLTVYAVALIKMDAVFSVLGAAGIGWLAGPVLVGAACSIPVRLFLIFTVGLGHPAAGMKYRRMLPYLMPWDWLWAPSPFLLVHSIGPEWALVLTAVLVYPPISQLILMRSIEHHRNRGAK
jgi:DNA-binding winged helix-turn-helix (wHTH) protein